MTTRRRLTTDERRLQLLLAGTELFAAHPYDSVHMDSVAEHAGVSRALLYRHFPSKHALFAAVYKQAADGLLDASGFDPATPFTEQVSAALDAHLDYFEANSSAVLAANRQLAGDPTIQAIIIGELAELRRRTLDVSGLRGRDREVLGSILTSWLVFVRVLVVEWLSGRALDKARVRDISLGALLGALGDLLPQIEPRPAPR